MERHAFAMKVKEGKMNDYRKILGEIWPELTAYLDRNGIHNFSIWNAADLIFGYYENADGAVISPKEEKVKAALEAANIRTEIDTRAEKIGYKIREARLQKIPYMLVVGAKEEEEGKVSVRSRYLGDEGMKDLGEFISFIKEEIKNKTIRKIEVQEEKK